MRSESVDSRLLTVNSLSKTFADVLARRHQRFVVVLATRDLASGRPVPKKTAVKLRVSELAAEDIRGLDLGVRAGEIVGRVGLIGSGMEHAPKQSLDRGPQPAAGGSCRPDGRANVAARSSQSRARTSAGRSA